MRLPRVPPARIVPRAGGRLLRLAYVAVIAVATLRGLDADGSAAAVRFRLWRALHPVVHAGDVVDGARNVALFAGFGAVWLATAAPGRLRRALVRATVAGALVSATVEAAQLLSPVRWASVLDVATNTAGAFAGAFVIALAVAAARASRPVALVPAPLALVALPYVAACVFEAFSPLGRPDQIPGAWGGPANRWAVAVAHLRLHPATLVAWTDLLLFAPAGALGVLLWVERGGRRWPGAAAATVGLGLVWGSVEALRGAAGGDLAPNAVLLRTAATLVGATLAAAALRHDATRVSDADRDAGRDATAGDGWPWLARRGPAAFAALLLLWSWRPFDLVTAPAAIAAKLGGDAFVPLAALAGQYTLHSVADVGVSFLLYVPVGAWLAARRAARGALRALGPGFGLALAAEAGQAFVGERTVDVTDVLVQCAGVFVGWAVLRQAEGLKRAALHPGDGRDRGAERDAWADGYGQADAYGDVDTATARRAHELA